MTNFNKPKKQNHNKIMIMAISIIFILITTSTIASLIIAVKEHYVNKNTEPAAFEQENYEYIVKDIDGKINIFNKNSAVKPAMVLEKPTIFLPEFDRKMLSDGIYLNNKNELINLIEDYGD